MDSTELAIRRIYVDTRTYGATRQEPMLGFRLDNSLTDISSVAQDCSSVSVSYNMYLVPGLQLYESKSYYLTRDITTFPVNSRLPVIVLCNGVSVPVYVKCKLCDNLIIVSDIELHKDFTKLLLVVDYVSVVLALYRHITSTRMSLQSDKFESENFVSSISYIMYNPTTESYLNMLIKICEAKVTNKLVSINPKYDGVCCWLYSSSTVAPCLLSQSKEGTRCIQRYLGRVAEYPDVQQAEACAVLLERVSKSSGEFTYVALDCFHTNLKPYCNRLIDLVSFLKRFVSLPGQQQYGNTICDIPLVKTKSRLINGAKGGLTSLLSTYTKDTDGFVVYIGSCRPFKVKPADYTTIDLCYVVNLSNLSGKWDTSNDRLLQMLQCPDMQLLLEIGQPTPVFEIKVSDGSILKHRRNRIGGNTDDVIANVIRSYDRDIRYSSESVWNGTSVKFAILLGRCFKYYLYYKYITKDDRIIDMGSGNESEKKLWKALGNRVVAVELDPHRVKILRANCSNCSNIQVFQDDMRNFSRVMSSVSLVYNTATFMRSLSFLTIVDIKSLISKLINYGIQKIIIVTMISDNLLPYHEYLDGEDYFKVKYNNNTTKVSYKCDTKLNTYSDNCYSSKQWLGLLKDLGLHTTMIPGSEFATATYGLSKTPCLYQCFSEVAIIATCDNMRRLLTN